ncbi:hypothetical protein [Actinomadura sp. 7K507]|uniref:hypothetical protein n=1 Tax=Actinomadura sp. 7K507 TaxID=2530365 RepID=UPI00104EFABF|nr:hypothetical protein [Actinomadura sp. 7K507]TDC91345.1 hypothetical protein E1285_13165 [Actinomadura sp. 7K507]
MTPRQAERPSKRGPILPGHNCRRIAECTPSAATTTSASVRWTPSPVRYVTVTPCAVSSMPNDQSAGAHPARRQRVEQRPVQVGAMHHQHRDVVRTRVPQPPPGRTAQPAP